MTVYVSAISISDAGLTRALEACAIGRLAMAWQSGASGCACNSRVGCGAAKGRRCRQRGMWFAAMKEGVLRLAWTDGYACR